MKDSLVIVAFFVAGIAAGLSGLIPSSVADSNMAMYALYALVIFVGLSIGSDDKLKDILRSIRPRLLLVPLATITGTLAFSALAALLLNGISVPDGLAVGSGFTYYSLSSVMIAELKAASIGADAATELGTIALLTNVIKEICTLVGAPLMVRFFGPLAPICTGGAASMDTLLPVIVSSSGKQWAFVALLHGILVDFSVPIFVSFFCSL